MLKTDWLCRRCRQHLLYYDIGFDDGYQCPRCKRILEFHELKKEADKEPLTSPPTPPVPTPATPPPRPPARWAYPPGGWRCCSATRLA